MSGRLGHITGRILRLALSAIIAVTVLLPPATGIATANSGDRSLYLHYTHNNQTARITYKRNGRWDDKGLRELNVFLADWRTKEPTKMDPALFDLLWAVYRDVGATRPIHVVSSYRSPRTNKMLASKSSGVADNSLHVQGKAIDFFIPGIQLSTLREAVMRHQVGGIGYYPTSGSPFVHADTGNVRAWPRMTRAQLKKVFPDGRTLHLPTDGKPLSNDGRRYAEAEWKKCRAVPCNGAPVAAPPSATVMVALNSEPPVPAMRPRRLMGEPTGATIQVAALDTDPAQRVVSTIAVAAPAPALRSTMQPGSVTENGAPVPARKSERLLLATGGPAAGARETALSALDAIDTPRPRILMTNAVAAYVGQQEPGAQEALRMIIERETTASLPKALSGTVPGALKPSLGAGVQTASLAGSLDNLGGPKGIFELTFDALNDTTSQPVATALADLVKNRRADIAIAERRSELVAPEIDHVNETLVHPVLMSASHFAVMTEAEGYLDKGTELGPLTVRIVFLPDVGPELPHDRFVVAAPLLVASR